MAIAFVQSTSVDAGSVSSANLAFTNNIAAQSLLIVASRTGATGGTNTVTDNVNAGNYAQDVLQDQTTDSHQAWIHSMANAGAGATTVTVTLDIARTLRFAIHEYSGLATSAALDQTNGGQGNTNAPTSGNLVTTTADELIFGWNTNGDNPTPTAGASFFIRENIASGKAVSEDRIVAATGTYVADISLSLVDQWAMVGATYKIAGGAAVAKASPAHVGSLSGWW